LSWILLFAIASSIFRHWLLSPLIFHWYYATLSAIISPLIVSLRFISQYFHYFLRFHRSFSAAFAIDIIDIIIDDIAFAITPYFASFSPLFSPLHFHIDYWCHYYCFSFSLLMILLIITLSLLRHFRYCCWYSDYWLLLPPFLRLSFFDYCFQRRDIASRHAAIRLMPPDISWPLAFSFRHFRRRLMITTLF
jgi:hypothetical protein